MLATTMFNLLRLAVVFIGLSTPVRIQPQLTLVPQVVCVASINKIGSSLATAAFSSLYSLIKAAVTSDEPILFMDATHPTWATKVSCGWIRTGVDKPIKITGSRTRLNIVGAIRLGHIEDAITKQYATVNGESIIDFFGLIKEKYKANNTINLILDGAGYHLREIVKSKAK